MKKKPIYLLCAACLAWSCTNDPTADPAGLAGTSSGELVPVSLELRMTDFAAPPTRATQNIRATAPGGGTALVDAEISAPQPASRTRTGGSGEFTIPDDQKVFRLDILQFNGTGTQAQLVKKATYTSEDGDYTRYEFSKLKLIASSEKNRIVILGNADPALAEKLQEKTSGTEGTKYESLLQERISRTGETDTSFPLVPRNQTDLPVFSGMAVTIVASGSQIGVELMRNVAKVNFSFFLTEPMRKAYDEWDIVLNTIPPASFYIPQAYEAPFPELQITDPYYSRVLGKDVASPKDADTPLHLPAAENLYLPVNLQYSVPGTVVSTRYLNAPVFATSLQLLGKKVEGSSITQTVLYMIPLGANFTDDYSIRPNNAINYRITLVSDSPDDSSVVKFIAGKFAGKFRQYKNPADGSQCWGYPDELEVWPTDVEYVRYPDDSGSDYTGSGTWMPWAAVANLANIPTGMTDGLANTQKLCTTQSHWSVPTAAYMCYRQLNGLTAPLENPAPNMWFLPAIHQLVGIYVAGGSQVAAMQPYYWSSTFLGEAASMQKSYRIGKNGLVEAPPLTPPSGQPEKAAVRGCRIPPPVELAPKTSRQQTKAQ